MTRPWLGNLRRILLHSGLALCLPLHGGGLALLALTLLSACNGHGEATEAEAPVDLLSRFDSEGKAWLCLNISLPQAAPLTRTVTFDDGIGDEWAVKRLTFVLFSGTSEATATVASVSSAYTPPYDSDHLDISGPTPVGTTTDQVTCTLQLSSDNINPGDNAYLLVVLNAPTTGFSPSAGTALSALTLPTIGDATGGFVMTNAPLATANDGTGTVTTLPQIDPRLFFATEDEAKATPAATVYVERAAAKVTVTESLSGSPKTVLGNQYISFETSDLAFAIDNYNTSSYLTRHFDASWLSYTAGTGNYRFTETAPLPNGHYRTHWSQDQNYTVQGGSAALTTTTQQTASWQSIGTDSKAYCAENTFDVSHMQDDYTTSVLVRLQLNAGTDFYTTSVTGQDIVFQPPSTTLTEEGTSASSSFSRATAVAAASPSGTPTRSTTVTYDGTHTATIDDYLRTWLMQNSSNFRTWVNTYAAGEPKHVNIAVSTPAGGGNATVTAVTQTAQASGTAGATAFDLLETTGLATYINANVTLKFYDDGYCYYRVPIRHFTDAETPWASSSTMNNNTPAQAYSVVGGFAADTEAAANAYLGRYGVVRNNWYTINITSVTHIGSPVIPPLTTAADDRVEQLLNATLSISGWERHEQDL